jgi:peptidoglycan/xylan/chitin deacetylase (PgdA/CDA1 family)
MKFIFFFLVLWIYSFSDSHIFVYHRFGDIKHPSTNTSIKELEKQFAYLQQHNYKVVPLQKILDRLKNKQTIPDDWVALTIDDSYKSFYTNGLEVFKKYNYPFTIFVYVKAVEKRYKDFTSWKELKQIQQYGSIGLHSYSHSHLLKLSNKELIEDTTKALRLFEKNLGFRPNIYVYPYGEYTQQIENTIKSFGFESVLNQSVGSVNKHSNIFDVNRIALVGDVNIKHKLRYKTLDVQWIEPTIYPKNGILTTVKARVDKKIKSVKLYVTGYGWQDIKVNDGLMNVKLNLKLKRVRNRVIIGTDVFTISNKLLIKGK